MGYVTNDPKKSEDQLPGGFGLSVDLQLIVCPECRRELPEWQRECPSCGLAGVPRTSLGQQVPDIPAHLLAEDDESAVDEEE